MTNFTVAQPNDPLYLRAAFSKLGLSEIAGPKDEPQVLAMYAACGHSEIHHDEVAWCAAFVGWCLDQANLPNTRSLLAISYAKYGAALDRNAIIPRGAIAVWHREGGNHVNFVLHDDGTTITCIGGNQGNGRGGGVTISRRVKAEAVAFRMPGQAKPQRFADADADEPEQQIEEPARRQPDDPGVEAEATTPPKPGLIAKARNWIGGLFTSGGLFYMDWRLGALLILLLVVLIAFVLWLFGKEPIKTFISRHLGSGA